MPATTSEERLAVVETKVIGLEQGQDDIKHRHESLESAVECIHAKVHEINEHIARQNGAIPHMSEKLDVFIQTVKDMEEKRVSEQIKQAEDRTKSKIVWTIIAAVGLALLSLGGKLLYDAVKSKVLIQPMPTNQIERVIDEQNG